MVDSQLNSRLRQTLRPHTDSPTRPHLPKSLSLANRLTDVIGVAGLRISLPAELDPMLTFWFAGSFVRPANQMGVW